MTSSMEASSVLQDREGLGAHMDDKASAAIILPHLDTNQLLPQPKEIKNFHRASVEFPSFRRFSVDSHASCDHGARRLPPELRFTPVNSPAENPGPLKPKRFATICPSQLPGTPRRCVRHCRLIGFTPLAEDSAASVEEDSIQFLGPRKVKAKEVAPCALFYKRADVFVSSEMKSQNVLSYSENHYRRIRFDDEVSINELEYAHQSSDQSDAVKSSLANLPRSNQEKLSKIQNSDLKIDLKALHIQKPIGHTFAKDGLTTMPLASEQDSEFYFDRDSFHIFADGTDSAPASAAHAAPWAGLYGLASDPEQSISSASSCGIQTSLWDTSVSSPTRATSPVSSIYSNISSSCHRQPVGTSFGEDPFSKADDQSAKFPHLYLNPRVQNSMTLDPFDWPEDHGSMADDENESNSSGGPPESHDDPELVFKHQHIGFHFISADSCPHFGDAAKAESRKLAEP